MLYMKMVKTAFSFVDLFSGIGGFRLALEQLSGRCVASSEIDNDAKVVYRANWIDDRDNHNLGDICKISTLPAHDLLVGGVPCQAWSIAGKNKGIQDDRGKLWYEVIRLVGSQEPSAFIFENVKGLMDPRHRETLHFLISSFENCGYSVHYKLLNSYDFGVPQNRDRLFIVGINKRYLHKDFVWPALVDEQVCLYDILQGLGKPLTNRHPWRLQRNFLGERTNVGFNKLTPLGMKNSFFVLTDIRDGPTSVHSWDINAVSSREKTICNVLLKNRRKPAYGPWDGNPMHYMDLEHLIPGLKESELKNLVDKNILRQYEEDGRYEFRHRRLSGGIDGVYRVYLPSATFFPTITARGGKDFVATIDVDGETDQEYKKKFIKNILRKANYRALSAEEIALIQGFPKDFKLPELYSKTVKLFGNAVSVAVVKALGESLIKTGCFDKREI